MWTRALLPWLAIVALGCPSDKDGDDQGDGNDDDFTDQYGPGTSSGSGAGSGSGGGESSSSGGGGSEGGSSGSGGSGSSGSSGSGGTPDPDPDPGETFVEGEFAVIIVELDCDLTWDMTGPEIACSGCDIAFEVSLAVSGGSCDLSPSDTSGELLFSGGYAYFQSNYLGAGYVGGGAVAWASYSYIYGAGGYTYLYWGGGAYR